MSSWETEAVRWEQHALHLADALRELLDALRSGRSEDEIITAREHAAEALGRLDADSDPL